MGGRAERVLGGVAAAFVVGALASPVGGVSTQADGPVVVVSPAEDLVDGVTVTITASGLAAGESYGIFQCAADATGWDGCATADNIWGEAGGDGTLGGTMRLDAILTLGYGPIREVECRVADQCIVGVIASVSDELAARAPLNFDPDAPPAPPPTLEVTPNAGLVDGDEVTATGAGFVWGTSGILAQCAAGAATLGDCDSELLQGFEVEDDGFAATATLSSIVYTSNHGAVDCRSPGACVLLASATHQLAAGKTVAVELQFDPGGPDPATPTLVVRPDHDLVDGQSVELEGTGFAPGLEVSVYQCSGQPGWDTCRDVANGQAGDDGTFVATAVVYALFSSDVDDFDCRRADAACSLVATGAESPVGSPRAARTPVHFDPDGPTLPPPTLTVSPATGLVDGSLVTVEGQGWTADGSVSVMVCAGSEDRQLCDWSAADWPTADAEGRFRSTIEASSSFEANVDDMIVDCRAAPGCAMVATDGASGRSASVPISFGDEAVSRGRYLDPVFGSVEITRDVVYRDTVDSRGNPIELKIDIYQPAGDSAEVRPAIVWMHGGYFMFGDKRDMSWYATESARRGYVAVSLQYRLRPEMPFPPPWDATFFDAMRDAYDDAQAGVEWLKDHAAEYRIDPRAIAAGGWSAGAATAMNLAYLPGQHGPSTSNIAAALPIAGGSLGLPDAGEPPVIAFHGTADPIVPWALSDVACRLAREARLRCDLVSYNGEDHGIFYSKRRDILRRGMDFLAETVLVPLGYLHAPPVTVPPPATSAPPPTDPSAGWADDEAAHGDLATTGSDSVDLVWIGAGLAAGGATLAGLARRRLARG